MLLNEPTKTPYDFTFNLFGFPIRVHPGFFLLPIVFGAGSAGQVENPGILVLIFIMVFFISILIHELGHSFALKIFGVPSRIVLYWFGGLAIHDTGWGAQSRLSNNQQIIVSLAGPGAGFALAAVFVGVVIALGGDLVFRWNGIFPMLMGDLSETPVSGNLSLIMFLNIGLFCNIVWNVLNLAPVLPLDGGQVCREVCLKADYQNGLKTALIVSTVAAALIAFAGFANRDSFIGIFFAVMGISSYMTLQQMSFRGGGRW